MPAHSPSRRRCLGLLAGSTCWPWLPARAQPQQAEWVAGWIAAAHDHRALLLPLGVPPLVLQDQTVRQRMLVAAGGDALRVCFSNRFGDQPLVIDAAGVGRSTGPDALSPGGLRPLRFDGRPGTTIAPHTERWSDPVALEVAADQRLAVSLHLPQPTVVATGHASIPMTSQAAPGDQVMHSRLGAPVDLPWNPIVTGIDVRPARAAKVVVAFGDSITQGAGASDSAVTSYPARLATRLRGAREAPPVVVLNAGLSGNRLLRDGTGPRGLARFAHDVLAVSGVTHAILLIGINDIGWGTTNGERPAWLVPPWDVATPEAITAGLQRLIEQARGAGVKLLLGTLTPFRGSPYWSEENERTRQAVNRWVRGRQDIAVIDFDAAMRAKDEPLALHPPFDSGDHLHPSEAGFAAMAAAADVPDLRE